MPFGMGCYSGRVLWPCAPAAALACAMAGAVWPCTTAWPGAACAGAVAVAGAPAGAVWPSVLRLVRCGPVCYGGCCGLCYGWCYVALCMLFCCGSDSAPIKVPMRDRNNARERDRNNARERDGNNARERDRKKARRARSILHALPKSSRRSSSTSLQ